MTQKEFEVMENAKLEELKTGNNGMYYFPEYVHMYLMGVERKAHNIAMLQPNGLTEFECALLSKCPQDSKIVDIAITWEDGME